MKLFDKVSALFRKLFPKKDECCKKEECVKDVCPQPLTVEKKEVITGLPIEEYVAPVETEAKDVVSMSPVTVTELPGTPDEVSPAQKEEQKPVKKEVAKKEVAKKAPTKKVYRKKPKKGPKGPQQQQ